MHHMWCLRQLLQCCATEAGTHSTDFRGARMGTMCGAVQLGSGSTELEQALCMVQFSDQALHVVQSGWGEHCVQPGAPSGWFGTHATHPRAGLHHTGSQAETGTGSSMLGEGKEEGIHEPDSVFRPAPRHSSSPWTQMSLIPLTWLAQSCFRSFALLFFYYTECNSSTQ